MSGEYQEYIRINPNQILQKTRPDMNQVIYSEDFDEETSIFRKLCLLPFEAMWYYFIIILGLASTVYAMINCMFAVSGVKSYNPIPIFYFCDVTWCLNTTLLVCNLYISKLKTTSILFPHRELWWLMVDYFSTIPMEYFVSTEWKAYIALNKTLKILYIFFIYRCLNSRLESKIAIRIFQLISQLLYFIILVSLIFCVILYKYDTNPDHLSIYDIVYIVSDHMTGKGFGQMAKEHYLNKLLVITSSLALFVGVLIICTANVTFLFFTYSSAKDAFRYKFTCLKNQMEHKKMGNEFLACLDIVFDCMWTKSGGSEIPVGGKRETNNRIKASILSKTFFAEITIDMCTGMFRHSMLLKKLPVAFLRDLSVYVTYEVYVQNQLICKLDEPKDKMIYIYKGVVELISDEDGETPVMQLTAGTCLSEICLFVPYESNLAVRCGSTCIFHILKRKDFASLVRQYPDVHKQLRIQVKSRLDEGKQLKKIQDVFNKRADKIKKCTNMGWLLYVLHKMTANAHPHVAAQHSMSNLLLERSINEDRFKNHIFSPLYLTLYTVPEEIQDYNDTLFAKSTFPYVFKPDTGLTLFWDIFISVLALAAGFLIPYYVFTHESVKNVNNFVYIFTIIWLIDIIIQLRISIIYEKKVVSGFLDILIMKLTSLMFLLDMVAVIPVEFFTAIFFYEMNQNYAYINRIFKMGRIIKLFLRWEGRYNSNPLYVRFVLAIFFILYCVFILSCIFYAIGHQGNGGLEEFEILLFYTSQMLSGVSVWVNGYSDFPPYQLICIILYFIICVIYNVIYGMIFSAHASVQLNLFRIKHNTKALIKAASSIDARYEYYIKDVMHDKITIDNGFGIQTKPGFFYSTVPKEFIGYFYKIGYEQFIKPLPIFANIPPIVLKEIFEEAAYTRNYSSYEIIFHVGDILDELYILISGTCEVICGVSLQSTFIRGVRELNSVEIGLQLPTRSTVITLTHCRILRIQYNVMRRVLCKRGSKRLAIHGQLYGWDELRTRIKNSRLKFFNPDVMDFRKQEISMQSQVYFNRVNPFYLDAYKASGMYRMRWMFMNVSFCPGGKFLEIWEIIRCICALLSALFFTSITFCFYEVPHPVGILKWALECTALIDIYIRMHVAYYNKAGILITHPANTIIYYAKHGLLIDLIASLPLHLTVTKAEHVILNGNKILQLHRYISFMRYKQQDKVVPLSKLYIFAHLPLMLVVVNILASILILYNCTIIMSESYVGKITCHEEGIFAQKLTQITNPSIAQIHAIYMVFSVFSKIALQGFFVNGRRNMLLVACMALIGFCLDIINAARVFGFFINQYVDIMHNDLRMKILKAFLLSSKIYRTSTTLTMKAENHIKLNWTIDQSNLHKLSKDYPSNLRRDILYKKFAPVLTKCCLDAPDGIEPFIRNILMKSEYRIFDANGVVQKLNDITDYTVIIYSGLVRMDRMPEDQCIDSSCVSLGPGSIIGSLSSSQYSRLDETIIAIGVLELLYVKSETFFNVMQHFDEVHATFDRLQHGHVTHIPGQCKFEYMTLSKGKKHEWKIKKYVKLAFIVLNVLNFFGAYVPQMIYFHDIIIVNIHGNYYFLISDACFVMAIVMVFFLPITNKKGDLMSKKDIIDKYLKPWLFYLSVISSIPFYIFIPITENMLTFYIITASRVNILLRNFFLFKIINTSIVLAPSMMFTLKFMVFIMIIILSIGGTTALLIFISDVGAENMRPYTKLSKLLRASQGEKYEHMVTYLYIVTNMFTHTSQPEYYPIGLLHVAVFIIVMAIVMVYNTVIYSTVVSMVQAIEQLKLRYVIKKNQLQSAMKLSDTSTILHDRLDFYCKMTWLKRKGFKIPQLLLELPLYLQDPISEDIFGRILEHHEFFGQIHDDFRRQLYRKLKWDNFWHGDFIAYQGTINETMYFVYKGIVVSLEHEAPPVVHTFTAGDGFALQQGITSNCPHDYSYRAVCDCVILSLLRTDWDYMFEFYPASKKIIAVIAQTLLKAQTKT